MEGTSGVAEAWRYAGKRGREPTDRHDLVSRAVVGLLVGYALLITGFAG